ncbi:MAG: NUDIX domain-containing protein [Nocardioidaceae bacterium]
MRSAQDWRFLPGGTRERNESLHDLASREVMEEAGGCAEAVPAYLDQEDPVHATWRAARQPWACSNGWPKPF